MKSSLYIFVSSHIPDGYVNAISHCIDNFSIERVILLDILKDNGKKIEREAFLKELKQRIITQFELLADGKYLRYYSKEHNFTSREIKINEFHKQRYSNYLLKIPGQNINFEVIPYNLLDEKIQSYVDNENCYFDVTTALKADLVDIFIVILSKHLRQIYTFELLTTTRTYDDKELVHNLTLDITYKYPNLSNTVFTQDKIVLGETVANKNKEIVDSLETGLNKLAKKFASSVLLVYLIIVILLYIGIIYFIFTNDWNWLEPKTYLQDYL